LINNNDLDGLKTPKDILTRPKDLKKWSVPIISGLILVFTVILAVIYAFSLTHEGDLITATGRNNVDFGVHYHENEFFGENPVPNNLHFLGHFTDFIEIFSSFSADFSDEFDISYQYIAQKRFVITHTSGGISSVIHEQVLDISNASGRIFGNSLEFLSDSGDDLPGGTYVIYPQDYMDKFLEFLVYNDQHLGVDTGGAPAFRNFSATLFIEFTYQIAAFPIGITESSMRGFQLPIGDDVFTLTELGTPGFTSSLNLSPEVREVNNFMIIIFVLVFASSGLGLFIGISRLSVDPNEDRQRANTILRKYASEIVISKTSLDLSGYKIMEVDEFEEILKLAINLNKHIICFRSSIKAEFCTLIDEYAYYYEITYPENLSSINHHIVKGDYL